ncbi:hypothetical protein BCR37DRAFT_359262 [Protomyces lactucae-debilis]|uniref:BAH domain-domain-containing protein n=1 Tax=Protomyces lactucae-debilis TaxID=2754530 RepID=A0A1Y2F8T2_PROLT|nr:uncharacterized protein BCR37DRAFT_359262 [Protomyces lactucae-debilis]ORY80322.1 hypothetical protein BCR37DRAFT_359262 [Protomyces lactucae-debilis]
MQDPQQDSVTSVPAAGSAPAIETETLPTLDAAIDSTRPDTAITAVSTDASANNTPRANPHATRHKGKARKVYTDDLDIPLLQKTPVKASQASSKAASVTASDSKPAKRKRSPTQNSGVKEATKKSKPRDRIKQIMVDGHVQYSYTLPNGTVLKANDCIYLVCEPPGEPYYLGRIMEFTKFDSESQDINGVRVNWFYRPRDVQRQSQDSRLVYATMHSDISPLGSIRGKCQVEHRLQISDADEYRRKPDCFYYEKLFDKFIHRYYDVIPVEQVLNVPDSVKRVLLERWRYVVVEMNRGKELAMEHRACKRCSNWCSSKDSVRCALCKSDYHMQCVQPPMPRKPSRGFAWTCTPCSRAELKRMEEARAPDIGLLNKVGGKERLELEMKERQDLWTAAELEKEEKDEHMPDADNQETFVPREKAKPEQWPYRYMGIHCNLADVLDTDDRIYPRAASRIGPRHQCTVQEWHGHPIEYFERNKRAIKRTPKAMKGKRSDERAAVEPIEETVDAADAVDAVEAVEPVDETEAIDPASMLPSERPAWMQEKPSGYLARGEGKTSETIWLPDRLPDKAVDAYLASLKPLADKLKVSQNTPNLLDLALKALLANQLDSDAALESLKKLTRHKLGEPHFTAEDKFKFGVAVRKYGSELHQVAEEIGKSVSECVRFYYAWKKTPQGQDNWGNSEARRPKSDKIPTVKTREVPVTELEKIADSSDDSAYDSVKAIKVKKVFACKFCQTSTSARWRRAPGTTSGSGAVTALCNRCADLWRRYAVQWESPEEVYRKVHELGAKSKKRKFEEELLKELPPNGEKPEKLVQAEQDTKVVKKIKVKEPKKERAPTPILPDPCEVCLSSDEAGIAVCCKCKLRVHASCYGIQEASDTWTCDVCLNESTPIVSTTSACVLCPSSKRGPLKRTAGNHWAHITCATWMQHVRFADVKTLQPIEGIGALPLTIWEATCAICSVQKGACIACASCAKPLHVECAKQHAYPMGFEIQPIKSSQSRREQLTLIRIGNESGLMTAVVYCPEHDLRRAGTIHPMQTPTSNEGEIALAAYIRTSKSSDAPLARAPRKGGVAKSFVGNTAPLVIAMKTEELRKNAAQGATVVAVEADAQRTCKTCAVTVSPLWHDDDADSLCHLCHFKKTHPGVVVDKPVPEWIKPAQADVVERPPAQPSAMGKDAHQPSMGQPVDQADESTHTAAAVPELVSSLAPGAVQQPADIDTSMIDPMLQ